ncbi:hypothetical protein RJT34_31226 [Clitoria ternatea]|uniref:Uncharacterized protein n=1 Tax=Clitoria ternatea TaxID=43366 RepID=A0AAN9I159_CLITE
MTQEQILESRNLNPTVQVGLDEYERWCTPWKCLVIVKLLGKRWDFVYANLPALALWASKGRPAGITDEKWKEMDDNAVSTLHLAMTDSVLSSIVEKDTAKEIWDTLIKLYEVKSLHNRIFLKRRLYTLRMSESTPSLPDSYDQLIINITNNNIVGRLHFDDVAGAILEEESRRKNKEDSKENDEIQKVTVWVCIPRLPRELYNRNMLWRIGQQLGTMLKVDEATSIHSRGRFARICVEVDESILIPLEDSLLPKPGLSSHRNGRPFELGIRKTILMNDEVLLATKKDSQLGQEERYWAQLTKVEWLKLGDRNTSYYHRVALIKRARKKIEAIKNENEDWIYDEEEINHCLVNFLKNIYNPKVHLHQSSWPFVQTRFLSSIEAKALNSLPSRLKVKTALFEMGPLKELGPDGIHAIFYKSHYLAPSIVSLVRDLWLNPSKLQDINETQISLITKYDSLEHPN